MVGGRWKWKVLIEKFLIKLCWKRRKEDYESKKRRRGTAGEKGVFIFFDSPSGDVCLTFVCIECFLWASIIHYNLKQRELCYSLALKGTKVVIQVIVIQSQWVQTAKPL